MTSPRKNKNSSSQRYSRKKKKGGIASRKVGSGKSRGAGFQPEDTLQYPVRLNRFIARAGICSRREADSLITGGHVAVDDVSVSTLGSKVEKGQQVTVRGKRITPAQHAYVLLNKPGDTITTASDDRGRNTVLDLIEKDELKDIGLFPVGRLDRHTRGVLLITNDGLLAHRLMHPSFEIEKIYRVETIRPVSDEDLEALRQGVALSDGLAKVDKVDRIEDAGGNEVGISIHEGRNRQIRRMFEKLEHDVKRLERVRYAGLTSSGIRSGRWRFLNEREILRLYKVVDL